MECLTVKYYDSEGQPVYKPKVKHRKMTAAAKTAYIFNDREDVLFKMQAYKCSVCGYYHTGTVAEVKLLTEAKKIKMPSFNIIDTIDLSQFKRKKFKWKKP